MQWCSSHTATFACVSFRNRPLTLSSTPALSHHRQHRTVLQCQAQSVTPVVAAHSLGVPDIRSEPVIDGQQRRYLTFQEYVEQQLQAQAAAAAAAAAEAAAAATTSLDGQARDAQDAAHPEQPKKRVPWNKGRKHTACTHSGSALKQCAMLALRGEACFAWAMCLHGIVMHEGILMLRKL